MGVSLELYRARIGSFNKRKCKQSSNVNETKNLSCDETQGDSTKPKRYGPHYGLGSKMIVLTLIIILSLPVPMSASHVSSATTLPLSSAMTSPLPFHHSVDNEIVYMPTEIPVQTLSLSMYEHQHAVTNQSPQANYYTSCCYPISQNMPQDLPTHTTTIPFQCQQCLLMISGIEPHPGPTPEEVIAGLCIDAPVEVRECLRTYLLDCEDIEALHKHIVTKNRVSALASTVEYLQVNIKTEDYTAKGLAFQLIYRIETLLPETCIHCNEEYCFGIQDKPLLACEVCGQGAHNPCVYDNLQVSTEDRASFTPELASFKINPLQLPELKYLCSGCIKDYLPDKEDGLKQSAKKKRERAAENEENQETEPAEAARDTPGDGGADQQQQHNQRATDGQNSGTGLFPPPTNGGAQGNGNSQTNNHPQNGAQRHENGPTTNNPQNGSQRNGNGPTTNLPQNGNIRPPANICPYYKRQACRYGIAGRQCPAGDHPKACKKLLMHGTRSPRGCNLGNNCDKFHPINMCPSSLKKRECYNPDCRLIHIKGTRRHRTQPEPGQNPHAPHPQVSRSQHHQNQWYDQRQPPRPQANNNQNFHRNQNYNYEQHDGFLEDAMRSINEMKQEMQAQMQSMSPQMLIQQTLRTFREEMLKEMDNRLAPYPPLPRNNEGPTMYGEPVNEGQYQGHREEIPRSYQPMPRRNLPY